MMYWLGWLDSCLGFEQDEKVIELAIGVQLTLLHGHE